MTRFLRGTILLLAAAAVGGLLDRDPSARFTGAVEAKPPRPKGPKGPKGKDELRKAYDSLTEVSLWMNADRARPPRDVTRLFDQAKDLYRDAVKASRDGDDDRRADELALASHDAARGLIHVLRANAPAASGLPAPPARDSDELDELLRRTRDQLDDAEDGGRGPGRAFLDASRRLYDQARKADRDDGRAIQLARAAEAWTHVGEHLRRADDREVRRPAPPDERRGRPRPPRERDEPPPPPPPPEE